MDGDGHFILSGRLYGIELSSLVEVSKCDDTTTHHCGYSMDVPCMNTVRSSQPKMNGNNDKGMNEAEKYVVHER
jgi:hypothetical protein